MLAPLARLTLGLVLLLAVPAGAQERSRVAALRSHARESLVGELEEYVAACQKAKLYAERNRVCELLIVLEPQHEEARKWLGYKRNRDGSWKEPGRRKTAKDFDAEALAESREWYGRIAGAYVEKLVDFHRENRDEITRPERRELFADVLRFEPENAYVREIRHEVLADGKWLLEESVRTLERRTELAALVTRLFEEAGRAEEVDPLDEELDLGLALTYSVATPTARVHVTGTLDEAQSTAEVLPITYEVFQWAFGRQPAATYPSDLAVYVMAQPSHVNPLLENHFAITDDYREFLAQIEASVIPNSGDFVAWSANRARRADAIVGMSASWLAAGAFEVGQAQGWFFQGLAFFMTEHVLATRLNWFVMPGRYSDNRVDSLKDRLIRPGTDWFREAFFMLRDKGPRDQPILDAMIRKDVTALQTEDLLYGTILTHYLIEGRPAAARGIAARIGRGEDPREVFEQELDATLEEVEKRILRWLIETGAGSEDT